MDSRSINLHGRDDEPRCTYEKTKPRLTKQRLCKILGDKQGALWQMYNWRMLLNSDFALTFYSMHITTLVMYHTREQSLPSTCIGSTIHPLEIIYGERREKT